MYKPTFKQQQQLYQRNSNFSGSMSQIDTGLKQIMQNNNPPKKKKKTVVQETTCSGEIQKLKLLTCEQGNNHTENQLNMICVDNQCQQKSQMFTPLCSLCIEENVHQKQNTHHIKNMRQFLKNISSKIDESFLNRTKEKKVCEQLDKLSQEFYDLGEQLFQIAENIKNSAKLLKDEIKQKKQQYLQVFREISESKQHKQLKQSLQQLQDIILVTYSQKIQENTQYEENFNGNSNNNSNTKTKQTQNNDLNSNNLNINYNINNQDQESAIKKYQNYAKGIQQCGEELAKKVQKILIYAKNPQEVEPTFKMVSSNFGNSLLIQQNKTQFMNSQQIISNLPQTLYTSRSFGNGDKAEIIFDIIECSYGNIPNHFFIGIIDEKQKDQFMYTEGVCLACNQKSKSMICKDYSHSNNFKEGSRYKIFIDVEQDTFQVFQIHNYSEKLIFSLNPLKFPLSNGKWLPTLTWDMKPEMKIDIVNCIC